jgi:sodium-dependent dicarboxylate transporter 2/3/5
MTAGMPFVLLIGAAPNAIAYESKQFSTGEFFRHGLLLSVVLVAIIGFAIVTFWPMLGMPTTLK